MRADKLSRPRAVHTWLFSGFMVTTSHQITLQKRAATSHVCTDLIHYNDIRLNIGDGMFRITHRIKAQ